MEFTNQDLTQCENLIRALRKGTFTLDGVEVIAMSHAMSWLGQLQTVMKAQVEAPPMKVEPVVSPITPAAPSSMKPLRKSKKVV